MTHNGIENPRLIVNMMFIFFQMHPLDGPAAGLGSACVQTRFLPQGAITRSRWLWRRALAGWREQKQPRWRRGRRQRIRHSLRLSGTRSSAHTLSTLSLSPAQRPRPALYLLLLYDCSSGGEYIYIDGGEVGEKNSESSPPPPLLLQQQQRRSKREEQEEARGRRRFAISVATNTLHKAILPVNSAAAGRIINK